MPEKPNFLPRYVRSSGLSQPFERLLVKNTDLSIIGVLLATI